MVKPKTPWDIAKPLLEADYLEGRVTDTMFPRDVVLMRPEFLDVVYKNFRTNFRAMKMRIRGEKKRADDAHEFLEHDLKLYTLAENKAGLWDGSAAQRLLMVDVKTGMHKLFKNPKEFWESRPAYQAFELPIFRCHVHQETRSALETTYWMYKKAKKKKKEAKKNGVEIVDPFVDPVLEL